MSNCLLGNQNGPATTKVAPFLCTLYSTNFTAIKVHQLYNFKIVKMFYHKSGHNTRSIQHQNIIIDLQNLHPWNLNIISYQILRPICPV